MEEQQTRETISGTQIETAIGYSDKQDLKTMTERQDDTNNNNAVCITSFNAEITNSEEDNEDKKWKLDSLSDEKTIKILEEVQSEMKKIPEEERHEWAFNQLTGYYNSVLPKSLIELMTANFFHGDTGISVDAKPDWLDIDKFRRGQKFALDYSLGVSYASMLSLFTVLSIDDGLKPLILTGASGTPYTAFKRYLSTFVRVQNWYLSDPWTAGTQAYKDIRAVRRTHAIIRKRIQDTPIDEFIEKTTIKDPWCPALTCTRLDMESVCQAPKPGQCPYTAFDNFPQLKEHKLNQAEMTATQFAFVGIHILNPKFFGMHHAADEDLEAYCHLWRGIGYLLGIDDDFNFCRGTLEDVRTRSRDFLECWVKPNFRVVGPEWEHMMRCMVEGVQFYFPAFTYESCLLDLAEIMNLHLPRTYNSFSYFLWTQHRVTRFFFNYALKSSALRVFMNCLLNKAIEKAVNYDEQKHEELKKKSAKMIDLYLKQSKNNELSNNWDAFLTVMWIVILFLSISLAFQY